MRHAVLLTILLSTMPAARAAVPVLAAYPACGYERLGNVRATDGRRPDGGPQDSLHRFASYARVLDRLSAQAEARGANAVVVNLHEAAFYTKGGRRSARPVYVSIGAGAIRLDDPARCRVAIAMPEALQERALRGELEQIVLKDAAPSPVP